MEKPKDLVPETTMSANFSTIELDDVPEPFQALLQEALEKGASDVHVDPNDRNWVIRFRIHGILTDPACLEPDAGAHLLNQAMVAAQMRPERHFEPEEGRLRIDHGDRRYDVRLSVVPTVEGESLHLRILSARWAWESMTQLGFTEEETEVIKDVIMNQTGLILVGGSTGGGKTTTLYALTTLVDTSRCVVTSIEDPVEYSIPNLRQIQVNSDHGLTMADGLRVLLRMDPDMILVGEIRDSVSAQIAARASLTGALVAATIHVPDAIGVVAALQNLSVPKHIVGGALRAIIIQTLLPTICHDCAQSRKVSSEEKALFEVNDVPVPKLVKYAPGCASCSGTGSRGRTVIAEVLPINSLLAEKLMTHPRQALNECYQERRVGCLSCSALGKAAKGEVTMDAAKRIVARQNVSFPGIH